MSATTVKTNGEGAFGIPSNETGLITHSITHSYKAEKKTLKNYVGNDIGVTVYNPSCEISIEGALDGTSEYGGKVGETLTLVNALGDHAYESAASGTIVIDSVDVKYVNEDYATISIKATNHITVT